MISIVTINQGFDKNLIKTINSINEQLYMKRFHIIIASNISTEEERKIKATWSNNNLIFILNEDNSLYNAMNIGIEYAKRNGEYV